MHEHAGGESAHSAPTPSALPGLSALTGHLKGEVTAFGGAEGPSQVRFDVEGSDWRWGAYTMQELLVAGDLDSKQGLQLEKCSVRAEGASLTMQVLPLLFCAVLPGLRCQSRSVTWGGFAARSAGSESKFDLLGR